MDDRPIFSIGQQHAGRDIYNVARDLNINQNSSAEDMLTIFQAIQSKVSELDIGEKDKKKIANQIEGAKIEFMLLRMIEVRVEALVDHVGEVVRRREMKELRQGFDVLRIGIAGLTGDADQKEP